jgi:uncharacterized protein (DUF1810 family)
VSADAFDLDRFVSAQDGGVYERALAELRAGRKRSHWMWFVFPQIAGLGRSLTAQHYALGSAAEARAYLDHPVLGPRLRTVVEAAVAIPAASAFEVFGSPDDLKLRSCLTLFQAVAPEEPLFGRALDRFFHGAPDPRTLALLETA